jgi:hypothetical protein
VKRGKHQFSLMSASALEAVGNVTVNVVVAVLSEPKSRTQIAGLLPSSL